MLGETYERSARYYAAWIAGHERAHWKCIGRIIAALELDVRDMSGRVTPALD